MSVSVNRDLALEVTTMRRVSWRLVPFLLLAHLTAYIDRVNVGFAALQMNKTVGIDPKTYGLGAGIFFIGYFFLEVPSNLALERFGARAWIARIMITWGVCSAAFALIGGPISFLVLRFLLGAAEAGFFPGMILYITYWYPANYRATIVSIFMVAIPVAGLIGSPISGAILYIDGLLGLDGWQWIFLLEAAPAVLLGIAAFVWLTDRPEHATWLAPQQQQWLVATLETERRRAPGISQTSVWRVMTNKYVLVMALVYSGAAGASTSLALWMPQLAKSFGLTAGQIVMLNAVTFGIAAVWMILWGRHSDRTRERVWHNVLPLAWMVVAMVAMVAGSASLWATILLLTLIAAGAYASKGPFWALSSEWLGTASAAAGLATINTLGNLSGFVFNYLIGWVQSETGSVLLGPIPVIALVPVCIVSLMMVDWPRPALATAGIGWGQPGPAGATELPSSPFIQSRDSTAETTGKTDAANKDLLDQLDKAEADAASAYGQLSWVQRLRRSGRQMVPYFALLLAVAASQSFDVAALTLRSARLMAEIVMSSAWADSGSFVRTTSSSVLREIVFPLALLVMFLVTFAVTLRDEFFSSKPRPISKDLNRAFFGFIIGQMKALFG